MLSRLQQTSNNADIDELVTAIRNGEVVQVSNLLDKGVDVNKKNKNGWYPLSVASCNGLLNIVELLLDAKANPNTQDVTDGLTPLIGAANKGSIQIVKLLLDAGADPAICDKNDSTPLHKAASNGFMDIMKLLLKHKNVKVNQKDKYGWTPLCTVSNYGKVDEVTLFLNAGADPNVKANDGQTPLHIASSMGHPNAVRLLLQAGADPNVKKNDGRTPLQVAGTGWEASMSEVVDVFKKLDFSQKLHVLFLQGIQLIKRGLPIDIFVEIISLFIERSHKETKILFEKHQRQIPLKLFDVSIKHIEEKRAKLALTEKEANDAISEVNLRLKNRMILC